MSIITVLQNVVIVASDVASVPRQVPPVALKDGDFSNNIIARVVHTFVKHINQSVVLRIISDVVDRVIKSLAIVNSIILNEVNIYVRFVSYVTGIRDHIIRIATRPSSEIHIVITQRKFYIVEITRACEAIIIDIVVIRVPVQPYLLRIVPVVHNDIVIRPSTYSTVDLIRSKKQVSFGILSRHSTVKAVQEE